MRSPVTCWQPCYLCFLCSTQWSTVFLRCWFRLRPSRDSLSSAAATKDWTFTTFQQNRRKHQLSWIIGLQTSEVSKPFCIDSQQPMVCLDNHASFIIQIYNVCSTSLGSLRKTYQKKIFTCKYNAKQEQLSKII